jgi:hypothetical protein
MSRIIHFELIEMIIQTIHIAFTSIYYNTHNNLMLHIYIWMGKWLIGQNVHAYKVYDAC